MQSGGLSYVACLPQCPRTHCNLRPRFGTCYFNCGKPMEYDFICFYSYDQNIWHNSKGRKFYFSVANLDVELNTSGFMFLNILEEDHMMEKLLYLMMGSREKGRKRGKDEIHSQWPTSSSVYHLLEFPKPINISLARR